MKERKFFTLFLFVYVSFLIFHSFSLSWDSPIVPLLLGVGFLVAVLAHTRYGILTIVLLLVHMILEWIEYARHGWHFSKGEIVLHTVHVCLDLVFLRQELKVHLKRFRVLSFTVVIIGLVIVFALNYQSPQNHLLTQAIHGHGHTHAHGNSSLVEPFVLGGMFGCILYHLKKKKQEVLT